MPLEGLRVDFDAQTEPGRNANLVLLGDERLAENA